MVAAYQPRSSITPSTTSGPELANIVEEVGNYAQLVVISRTSGEPANPNDGDTYINDGSSSWSAGSADDVMMWIDNEWRSTTPEEGWHAYVQDEDNLVGYDGSTWDTKHSHDWLNPHVVEPPHATDSGTDVFQADVDRDVGDGERVEVDFQSGNATTSPTFENTGGTPAGADPIVLRNSSSVWVAAISAGRHTLQRDDDNSQWLLLDPALNEEPFNPTGSIVGHGGSSAPSGWLFCNGQAVSRTTFSDLFNVIGTTFGSGDGSTTFNVPDLRDRFPVGTAAIGGSDAGRISNYATALGDSGGQDQVTLTVSDIPSHDHTMDSAGSHNHGGATGGNTAANVQILMADSAGTTPDPFAVHPAVRANGRTWTGTYARDASNHSHGIGTDGSHSHNINTTGGGGAHDNLPPFLAINWIVKT